MNTNFLLLILLILKSLYIPLNHRTPRFYWKFPLDDRIPLIEFFVIPYTAYVLYLILSVIFLWKTPHINNILLGLIFSYLISSVIWYFFPNGVKRPVISGNKLLHRLLKFIYHHDHDSNGLPSAHVFVTLICSFYLSFVYFQYAPFIWIIAFSIILSTLFTKQHYLVDILGGAMVSLLVVLIVGI